MQISRLRRSVASSSLREFRTWLAAVSLFRPRGSAIDQVNQPTSFASECGVQNAHPVR
jgi:hypothetical protein